MYAWRTMVVVGLLAVAAIGCGGTSSTTTLPPATSSSNAAPTTSEPVTTTVGTSTSTVVPTSTASAEPPIPDTSGDDWEQILQDIFAFFEWLFINPPDDTALVDEVFVPDSPVDMGFRPFLVDQIENGWRDLPHPGLEIRRATLESMQNDGNTAVVLAVTDFDGAVTVDASDEPVVTTPDRPPNFVLYTLELRADGQWRLSDIKEVGPAPDEVD